MKTLLIANRGEIACRIICTARRCGIKTVAVYSSVDANAQHVLLADEAVCIGAAAAADSYLNIDRVLDAALRTGADAIHPGYGFLSENPSLVDACESAGITFVGPSASAMRAMGLKDAAKRLMSEAGVPVVPGYHGESQDPDLLAAEAQKIGYPVLIKARAGGGGKGMRQVLTAEEFPTALEAAQRESQASFADAHVLIEKLISVPRHIEVQVFGDKFGNVVHLFERDCSLQRRHQKVIEEAPAPGMSEPFRAAMTEAAIQAAKAINYQGAGTIEFIVDGSAGLQIDRFWFMEMNTRLQVEHPVTEAVTGLDLVEWQLRVADGEALPLQQNEIQLQGHAVEARLYAENPAAGFLPAVGVLKCLRFGADGRVDSGVVEGDSILPYYDPLLAKLISHGRSRTEALQSLTQQLANCTVLGTETNREFLWQLTRHRGVLNAEFDTSYIATHLVELIDRPLFPQMLALAALALVDPLEKEPGRVGSIARRLGSWQLWGSASRRLQTESAGIAYDVSATQSGLSDNGHATWVVSAEAAEVGALESISIAWLGEARVRIDGLDYPATVCSHDSGISVQLGASSARFDIPQPGLSAANQPAADTIVSPMPGRVVAVQCAVGDVVELGQVLMSVEAMKMEQELDCPRDGVIEQVLVSVGDQVQQGELLLSLEGEPK